jgi:flagellar hook assembly protein FlgD
MVSIDPEIFSPNNDGISDQLNIYINTSEPGWILNITILNCAGRVVRNLANNFMTGSTDQLLWDGLGDDFQKVQPGIYILSISLFERTGKNQMKRFACVLTDHL